MGLRLYVVEAAGRERSQAVFANNKSDEPHSQSAEEEVVGLAHSYRPQPIGGTKQKTKMRSSSLDAEEVWTSWNAGNPHSPSFSRPGW